MDNSFYKKLIDELPVGYAYHKIICDDKGSPVDYEFIEANEAFEQFTGLKSADIVGKTICEVIPDIKKDSFDWISEYGKIALGGGSSVFKQYSAQLNKWYRINAFSPDKFYFITYFIDVTKEMSIIDENKMLITALNDAVFSISEDYIFEDMIVPIESNLFISLDHIIGKSAKDIFKNKEYELIIDTMKIAKSTQKKQFVDYPSILENDNRWHRACIRYITKNNKNIFVVNIVDITKEKLDEQALEKTNKELERSNQMLKSLMDSVPDLIFYKDLNFNYFGCNSAFEKFVGKSKEEIVGKTDFDLFGEETASLFRAMDVEMIKTNAPRRNEESVLYPDGTRIDFETLKSPYCDNEGNVIGLIGLSRDVTERKLFEKQLIETTNELDGFFSINLDLLCIADTDGYFIKLNKSWETTFGYPQGYLETINFMDLVHPDDFEATFSVIEKLKTQKQVLSFVNRYKCSDGSYKYIEWRSNPHGKLIYAAARDITERILMEESLYIEKEMLRTTLLSIGDGVISVDKHQKIVFINNIAEKMTGWTQKEAFGKPFEKIFNIINEQTQKKAENPINKVLSMGQIVELANHTALIRKDEVQISIEDSAAPIHDKYGKIQGVVLVFRDVTEKKKIHEEIEYLSFHDYLTGLNNRRFYEEELLKNNNVKKLPLSIIMLDVNGLKLTNDAFGHEKGDELLTSVSKILKNSCREYDIVARTGGDEFGVILPKTDKIQCEIVCKRIAYNMSIEKIDPIVISVALGFDTKTATYQDIGDIIKNAENNMYKEKLKSSRIMRNQTIQLIMDTLKTKYANEKRHVDGVSQACYDIGLAMNFEQDELIDLKTTAYMHDIGKITIPIEILNKPDKLTADEYDMVKRHPEAGYQILKSVEEYSTLAEYVLCHHEKWDGKGYPRGLKGDSIPLISRIITVADAYEAMTSGRPFKKALDIKSAVAELRNNSGTQFDPQIVDVFINKVLKYTDNKN